MDNLRTPSPSDRFIEHMDRAIRTVAGIAHGRRDTPRATEATSLTQDEKSLSAALMRVNHVGEVCAQALYSAQAVTSRSEALREHLSHAAQEEEDHLAWTAERLDELNGRVSLLNPLWWSGAFGLGLVAGLAGDDWSLGFVVETERQVEAHLAEHLERLPTGDLQSRAIVAQMKLDEAAHADWAEAHGARPLPEPIKQAMRLAAKVMTTTAHRV